MSIIERLHRENAEIAAQVQQVPTLPRNVEVTARNIENNFQLTADALIASAIQLEKRAQSLRDKAEHLISNRNLADDIRRLVQFEQDARDEAKSLALIAMPDRQTEG